MKNKSSEKLKKELEERSKKGHGVSFESFTPLQVIEQITIFIGLIVFLTGCWILVYLMWKALFIKGGQ